MNDENDYVIEISTMPDSGAEQTIGDGLSIIGETVEGGDFSSRELAYLSVAHGSVLKRCTFKGSHIRAGGFGGGGVPSVYVECDFEGSRIQWVVPGHARFLNCSFNGAVLKDMQFQDAEFVGCSFDGAVVQNVIFNADEWDADPASPPAYKYENNDFSSARLRDVTFRGGIPLAAQKLPSGEGYILIADAASALASAVAEIGAWDEEGLRAKTAIRIEVLQDEVARKQQDLFVERSFMVRGLPKAYAERLLRALVGPRRCR